MTILSFFIKLILKRLYFLISGKSFKDANSPEMFWDIIADNLNKKEDNSEKSSHIDIALENTKKYLKKSDVVLDYGCAAGSDAIKISSLVERVDGVDISSKMIEIANKRSKEKNIENVHFYTLSEYDKENRTKYDVIIVSYVLHLIADSQPVIDKINNLLVPGGFFISSTPCLGDMNSILKLLFRGLLKMGLIPELSLFKGVKLTKIIKKENFTIITNVNIKKGEKFIVAKKFE